MLQISASVIDSTRCINKEILCSGNNGVEDTNEEIAESLYRKNR
jgi:hypothetical protein